jgi:hypothetical protein
MWANADFHPVIPTTTQPQRRELPLLFSFSEDESFSFNDTE